MASLIIFLLYHTHKQKLDYTCQHTTTETFIFYFFILIFIASIALLSFSLGFLQVPLLRFVAFHARLSFSGIVSLV